jgi:HK97 family phage major capsid protein
MKHLQTAAARLRQIDFEAGTIRERLFQLNAKINDGKLTSDERIEVTSLNARALLLATDRQAAHNENEAQRAEAARIGTGGSSDADTTASERARALADIPATNRGDGVQQGGPARGRTFAAMFPTVPLSMDGWASAAEYLAVIGSGRHDSRLRIEASSGVDDPSGGYAVPSELAAQWITTAIEDSIVMPRAVIWPMSTRERQVPAFDYGDRSEKGLAGLTLQWESETGALDLQASKTRKVKLVAHKGAIYTEVSNELLADGLGYPAQLNLAITRSMSYGLDWSFLWGVGGAQPLGVFNSGALITITKESGQAAGTIGYQNLLKMFARLNPSSVANSVWLAHASTIPQLATLSIVVGTGGSTIPVMTESNGQFRILTRPVIFTEKAKPLGQLGDIALMDFTQYVVGLRNQMFLERSEHIGFSRDVMTYRATLRVDGQPNIETPYELPNNAATVSPFVTLEARA